MIPLQARCGPEGGRGIALLFHDRGTRRGWVVSSTPRPLFTSGKDPVPILQEAGRVPGLVWTGGKSRPHQDSIPNRPARSQPLYRRMYPAHKCLSGWEKSIHIWEDFKELGPFITPKDHHLKQNFINCKLIHHLGGPWGWRHVGNFISRYGVTLQQTWILMTALPAYFIEINFATSVTRRFTGL